MNAPATHAYIERALELYRSGRPLIIYDTETTGLLRPEMPAPEPWHIAAIKRYPDGRRLEAERILYLAENLPPIVVELCAVAADMPHLTGKPPAEVLPSFGNFIKGAVIVGHNIIDFDNPVMVAAYENVGAEVPVQFTETDVAAHKLRPRYGIDTKWLAYAVLRDCAPRHIQTPNDRTWGYDERGRKIYPYSLTALGRFLECSFVQEELHNAMADIRLCEQVLDELLARGAAILRACGQRSSAPLVPPALPTP